MAKNNDNCVNGTRSKSTRDQNQPGQIREPLTDRG